ncbi:MAG: hypothetical protein AVDCRST_MAG30-2306 [uncultured Solirubrobacteraceae bacterium]|uniref:Peptidase M48 domain-containing protein n=1 Tax=uncultured Solirubrobacteraceae bacterium TaxID=1162706 RepID=A0A6J4SXG7_9ACTN|nr:MAG: hypothetical protein AVDCRST_MAG30-2306 [uncultured Solirubrobacteraceae bacterium]
MGPDRGGTAPRALNLSLAERDLLVAGPTLIVVATIGCLGPWTVAGTGRLLALAGLGLLAACASLRAIRLLRWKTAAPVPSSVGRTRIRIRPTRGFAAIAMTLALGLPLVSIVALLALVEWTWLPIAGVLLVGCAGVRMTRERTPADIRWSSLPDHGAAGHLQRLCFLADLPVPELVVERSVVASAWTSGGRIHVTDELLGSLSSSEIEGVLAHEVAHLARRDAAVMEVCSAPSLVLVRFAALLSRCSWGGLRSGVGLVLPGFGWMWAFAVLCVPPAFLVGWIARFSVLALSRTREFAADATAAALTGNPSALSSALMKLDAQHAGVAHLDLRQAAPDAALCIVAPRPARLGRLFSTHPSTAARVERLQRIEDQLQS